MTTPKWWRHLWPSGPQKTREEMAFESYLHALTAIKDVAVSQSEAVVALAETTSKMLDMMKVPEGTTAPQTITPGEAWVDQERRRLVAAGTATPDLDTKLNWMLGELDKL